ncbi:MAG: hypothetical protein J6X36_01185 [Lachnospiraceae bacterium]|nr:hypothetical protein [Lachnospiraceae bacterium]
MKLKRILAISLSLTMLFSMSLSSVAAVERTTPVEVPDEYNKTDVVVDRDVKVVGNDYAVRVVNEGQSEGVTTFADIGGNVSLTNTDEATALDSSAYTEGTDIFVDGSVDAHTDSGEATAIHVWAGNNGDASVLVDGNVTATADKGCATGVSVYTEESSVYVNVGGDVTVDSKDKNYGEADGIIIQNFTSTVYVEVRESVNVKSETNDAGGVIIAGSSTTEQNAKSTVIIHADLNVEGYGVVSAGTADQSQADVIIEGTLDATKGAVLLKDYKSNSGSSNDESKKSDLNLYVWKINDHGAPIAQRMINDPGSSANHEIKADEDFINNNIYYIIKVEQPIEGGYFYVTDKNGNSLTKKNGNIVAKEGTVLLLKADLEADYVINEAYGDISKNLSLVNDANGNYSLVVKRGGGVYFNALCSKSISNAEFRRREEVQDAIGFIDAGPKNSGNITIACFNSNSIDSSVVKAIRDQEINYKKKRLKNFTVTILCMKGDVYGKIVIDSGDLLKHTKNDGSVDLKDLYEYFIPITND